jgi:hypothetical protein
MSFIGEKPTKFSAINYKEKTIIVCVTSTKIIIYDSFIELQTISHSFLQEISCVKISQELTFAISVGTSCFFYRFHNFFWEPAAEIKVDFLINSLDFSCSGHISLAGNKLFVYDKTLKLKTVFFI